MRVLMVTFGAVRKTTGAASQEALISLAFVVCALRVVAVPGVTSVLVVHLVLLAEASTTGALETLVLGCDGPTVWVIAGEFTDLPVRTYSTVVVDVDATDAATARTRDVGTEVAIPLALGDVAPTLDRVRCEGTRLIGSGQGWDESRSIGVVALLLSDFRLDWLRDEVVALN